MVKGCPIHTSYFVKRERNEFFEEAGGIYLVKRGSMLRKSDEDKKIGHVNGDEISGWILIQVWLETCKNLAKKLT